MILEERLEVLLSRSSGRGYVFLVSSGLTMSMMPVSDKASSDSYDCPDNCKLVDDGDDVLCKSKKCTKDQ